MKLFAQHGHQPSDKIIRGLNEGVIHGVIFSPRYLNTEKLYEIFEDINTTQSDIFIDPEFYATRHSDNPNNQLGYLRDWQHFIPQRRRDLVTSRTIDAVLQKTFEVVDEYNPTGIIAPNIYISESYDSMEAGISMNFISRSKSLYAKLNDTKPVYATLAVDHKALLNTTNFISFINDITALDNPPDGFYILIGRGVVTDRSDLVNSEIVIPGVIGGWMLLNYILSINGFQVINGYSDVLTPFLGAVGGNAGATGWWSNLRTFSLGRYIRPERKGGRQPNIRYLSKKLLNRIKMEERENYSEIIPEIKNNLHYDQDYNAGIPNRTVEALQTWEAINSLNSDVITGDIEDNLIHLDQTVKGAIGNYSSLVREGLSEGFEAINEYLDALGDGINVFRKLAEL